MANPEHVKQLLAGVSEWNDWRRKVKPSGIDLSAARFHGISLSGADFSRVNLSGAIFAGVGLSKTKLSRTNLGGANLSGADLFKANLFKAALTGADLSHARLQRANLSGSDFFLANLSGADLSGANLSSAMLGYTDLSGAQLERANLNGVRLFETEFTNTNLTRAKGLDMCIHQGPSQVDMRTLQISGMLPMKFLRGCGLSEESIKHLPVLIDQTAQFYSCFISYSHEDKAFARFLHDRLQGQGVRCWLDEHELLPGDDLHESIDRGIRLWDKVLLCASHSSLTSWWVDDEINRTFQKEAQIMKERSQKLKSAPHPNPLSGRGGEAGRKVLALIPLNLDGFLFSSDYQSGKKAEITSRVAANFVGWEKDHTLFDRELGKVICALRTDEGGRANPPTTKL